MNGSRRREPARPAKAIARRDNSARTRFNALLYHQCGEA